MPIQGWPLYRAVRPTMAKKARFKLRRANALNGYEQWVLPGGRSESKSDGVPIQIPAGQGQAQITGLLPCLPVGSRDIPASQTLPEPARRNG